MPTGRITAGGIPKLFRTVRLRGRYGFARGSPYAVFSTSVGASPDLGRGSGCSSNPSTPESNAALILPITRSVRTASGELLQELLGRSRIFPGTPRRHKMLRAGRRVGRPC